MIDPEVWGFLFALAVIAAVWLLLGLARASRRPTIAAPAQSTPAPGRATTPRCWCSGPRGGHAYARDSDRIWTCMHCGDQREAS